MHDEFEDLLLAYTTHSLTAAEQARMEQHLAECAACRENLLEWQSIAAATRKAAHKQAVTLPILNVETLVEKEQTVSAYVLSHTYRERSLTFVYMVAALLGITGAFVISQFQGSSIIQPAQAIPTPVVYVEVVIAQQPIGLRQVITSNDVLLYRLPESTAPFDAVVDLETVIGKISRTYIACGQPILSNMLVTNARDVFQPGFVPPLDLSCDGLDFSPLSEPLELAEMVVAAQEITDGRPLSRESLRESLIERPYPAQLIPADALRDIDRVAGGMSSIHILREQIVLNRMFGVELPSGTVAIRFSLDNVHTDLSGLRPGNRVDVIVGMQYVPVNDNFQTLQANGEPVQALEADGEQEPKLLMQRVISGAQILIVESEDWITLAVGSEEAVLMRWVAEAQLPLLLARA